MMKGGRLGHVIWVGLCKVYTLNAPTELIYIQLIGRIILSTALYLRTTLKAVIYWLRATIVAKCACTTTHAQSRAPNTFKEEDIRAMLPQSDGQKMMSMCCPLEDKINV